MKKYIMKLYFVIFFIICYVFCNECVELDKDHCYEYKPADDDTSGKQCLPVGEGGKCELKACEELNDCNMYKTIGLGEEMKNCFQIYDEDGNPKCELKTCSQIEDGNCMAFTSNDEDFQCLQESGKTTCKLQQC